MWMCSESRGNKGEMSQQMFIQKGQAEAQR